MVVYKYSAINAKLKQSSIMVMMSLKMVVFLVKKCAAVTTKKLDTLHVHLLTIIVTKNALFTRINSYHEDTRKNRIIIIIITVIIPIIISAMIIAIIMMKVATVMKMIGLNYVLLTIPSRQVMKKLSTFLIALML